nr:origin recognition complex subunit 5-like [Cherax quadricarinatus]
MYETILNHLSGTVPSSINNYSSYASCDNIGEFIKHLRNIAYSKGKPRMSIVLEQSERLRDSDANILPVLCRLQELTQDINIIVIFLSSLPIEKFRAATGFMEPVVINFPQYTKGRRCGSLNVIYSKPLVMHELCS